MYLSPKTQYMNICKYDLIKTLSSDYNNNEIYAKKIFKNIRQEYLHQYSIDLSEDEIIEDINSGKITRNEFCPILKSNIKNMYYLFMNKGYKIGIDYEERTYLVLSEGILGKFNPNVNDEFWEDLADNFQIFINTTSEILSEKFNTNIILTCYNPELAFGSEIGFIISENSNIIEIYENIEDIMNEYKILEAKYINHINESHS